MSASFEAALAAARVYEKSIAAWLQGRGWKVLPTYDFSGKGDAKAPKLMAAKGGESLVIPDLLACRAGVSKWAEVKFKTAASMGRISGCLETGISLRLWRHYLRVEEESGIPVWIIFVHKAEKEIRGASVRELRAMKCREYAMGPHGMILFPYDQLWWLGPTVVARLDRRSPAGGRVISLASVRCSKRASTEIAVSRCAQDQLDGACWCPLAQAARIAAEALVEPVQAAPDRGPDTRQCELCGATYARRGQSRDWLQSRWCSMACRRTAAGKHPKGKQHPCVTCAGPAWGRSDRCRACDVRARAAARCA